MVTEEHKDETGKEEDISALFKSLSGRFKPGRLTKTTTFHFSIDDENWTVGVGAEHCTIQQGPPGVDADCLLTTSKKVFMAIFRGEYTPSLMDFISGKIKSNNPMLLAVLKDAFGD